MTVALPEYKGKVGACKACGNSPVPHTPTYCMATAAVWGNGVTWRLMRFSWYRKIGGSLRVFTDAVDRYVYGFWHTVGLLSYKDDPNGAATYRSQVIWEEAARRGIVMQQIHMLGRDSDIYRAKINGQAYFFESLPIPASLIRAPYTWIDDKILLKRVLEREGIPVPRARSVTTLEEARQALRESGTVTLKPRSGTRGRHTTTRVSAMQDLDVAFRAAQQLCRYVSIEENLLGSVCRATVVNGALAGFFEARPPRVTGDGVSSIRELVEAKNRTKPDRVLDVELTEEHLSFLQRTGLQPDSIIEKGRTIDLTHRTGRLFGGETRELFGSVHPKLRAYVERAAASLQVPIAGFDLIIEDPEKDPDDQKWGIIEANSLPFIDLHYLPLYGTPTNVAAAVWNLWNK